MAICRTPTRPRTMATTRNHCHGVLGVSTTELIDSVIEVYDAWPGPSSEAGVV